MNKKLQNAIEIIFASVLTIIGFFLLAMAVSAFTNTAIPILSTALQYTIAPFTSSISAGVQCTIFGLAFLGCAVILIND